MQTLSVLKTVSSAWTFCPVCRLAFFRRQRGLSPSRLVSQFFRNAITSSVKCAMCRAKIATAAYIVLHLRFAGGKTLWRLLSLPSNVPSASTAPSSNTKSCIKFHNKCTCVMLFPKQNLITIAMRVMHNFFPSIFLSIFKIMKVSECVDNKCYKSTGIFVTLGENSDEEYAMLIAVSGLSPVSTQMTMPASKRL